MLIRNLIPCPCLGAGKTMDFNVLSLLPVQNLAMQPWIILNAEYFCCIIEIAGCM